ncbi:MAG: 30S ribosomal protein S7 [Candidatus Omnitrophica bacterium]|nr:30S ribosomal protein S7 [Candidatus Omnitrophota bacterium]
MRRNRPQKRKILPDPRYNSKLVARFINMIMFDGKKSLAENVVYGAIEEMGKRTSSDNPLEVFQKAIENVKPLVEVKSRRVGGATYQVPIEVRSDRSLTLALRWIRDFSRSKKGKPMKNKLADELTDAYNKEGASMKKREDTHRMAEANKAFSHYRW